MSLRVEEIEHPELPCEICGDPKIEKVNYVSSWGGGAEQEAGRTPPRCYSAYKHV
ncbi:hypothetical protein TSOC111612_01395 [Tsukamurella ocularis]|uniref:hypothetical protein n=1 Tax=Tsukamurella ocularis TaxID=1970234 RepID=UPI0039EE94E2